MEMPFGKYRGEAIEDIPLDYLKWLYENVELYGDLEVEVSDRLAMEDDEWPF